MALIFVDRAKVRTQTAGTGTLILGAPVAGFQSFASVGDANETYYAISDVSGNWEIGRGTYNATANSISRDTVLSSSAGGTKVNFPVGSKNVYGTYPAAVASQVFAGTGNAPSATYANTVAITADNSTNATNYPVFINAATGNLALRSDTGFTYNPSTNTLTAGTFSGALAGNAATVTNGVYTSNTYSDPSWLTTLAASKITGTSLPSNLVSSSLTSVGTLTNLTVTNTINGNITGNSASAGLANTVDITNTNSGTTVYYPTFVANLSTGQVVRADSDLSYRTDTNTLTAPYFSGSLTGNADTATALKTARTINGVSFDGTANIVIGNPIRAYQKSSDVTASGTVAFPVNAYISVGTAFGTMASNGVFSFTRAGTYQINVTFNVSADPDAWGGINGTTGVRYNQVKKNATGAYIGSSTDIITVSSGDTYEWKVNNLVVVYGSTNNTATRIQFTQLA
jgi:hypothetical protein